MLRVCSDADSVRRGVAAYYGPQAGCGGFCGVGVGGCFGAAACKCKMHCAVKRGVQGCGFRLRVGSLNVLDEEKAKGLMTPAVSGSPERIAIVKSSQIKPSQAKSSQVKSDQNQRELKKIEIMNRHWIALH